VSDPTTPPGNDDRVVDVPAESTDDVDSEPIDVNELLESTRKLFDPEEIQRAMEQAGYTPEPASETSGEGVDAAGEPDEARELDTSEQVESEPDSSSLDQALDVDTHLDATDNSEADSDTPDVDTVNESTDGVVGDEEPPLRGVNVLSIVGFLLALALSPLAVIFGYIALGQTRRARQRGETLALWAIGLGWIVFAAWVVLIASLVWIGYQQGITLDSLREFIDLFSLP
jgi:hypothetical protein